MDIKPSAPASPAQSQSKTLVPTVYRSEKSASQPMKVSPKTVKTLLAGLMMMILVSGVGVGVYLVGQKQQLNPKASDQGIDLVITPAQLTKKPDEEFQVTVGVDPKGQGLTGVELYISYKAEDLLLESIDKGQVLTTVGSPSKIGPGTGSITLLSSTTPPTTGGTLAVLKFKALKLTTGSDIAVDSTKTQISTPKENTNALGTTKKSTVIIANEAAAVPSIQPIIATPSASIQPTEATSSSSVYDFNNDTMINSIDLSVMYSGWGIPKTDLQLKTDLNKDGVVNGIDYSAFIVHFKN